MNKIEPKDVNPDAEKRINGNKILRATIPFRIQTKQNGGEWNANFKPEHVQNTSSDLFKPNPEKINAGN